ncbi:MAG: hypothetical protein AB1489_31715, partial [Acidobacteriota bacterium]
NDLIFKKGDKLSERVVDSYNSRNGSYKPGLNQNDNYAPVASNKIIKFDDGSSIVFTKIYGDADYYGDIDCGHDRPRGQSHLKCKNCTSNKLEQKLLFDPVDYEKKCGPAGEIDPVVINSDSQVLSPGCYKKIDLSAGRLILKSGDYFIENMSMSAGEVVLQLDSKKNPVRLYIGNKLDISGGRFGIKDVPLLPSMESPTKLLIAVKSLNVEKKGTSRPELSAAIYNYSKDKGKDKGDADKPPCDHCHSKHDPDGNGEDELGNIKQHKHSDHKNDLPAQSGECEKDEDCQDSGEIQLEGSVKIIDAIVYGAIVANDCTIEGKSEIHYDLALRKKFKKANKFRLLNWSYKNFF